MVIKRPIRRSVLTGCIVFIVLLCLLLSVQSYFMISTALYSRYNAHLRDVLVYALHNIDQEDIYQCVQTGESSPKRAEAQALFNRMVDDFELEYIYILIPDDDGKGTMTRVLASASRAEREAGEEDRGLLNAGDSYQPQQTALFLDVMNNGSEIAYFKNDSGYGQSYTACFPLKASDGRIFALLCADVSAAELRRGVASYVTANIMLTLAICVVFSVLLLRWMGKNVTRPVTALEESTRCFALKGHGQKDPKFLIYEPPEIHTHNELESLSAAILQMSVDMKTYVEDILSTERRMRATAQEEAADMSRLAFQDPLTHMKSKAAYDVKKAELEQAIAAGDAEFALAMVDLNNLKKVNDNYGHENGNKYIIGACRIMGDIFRHSPIYRIGGDEFVTVLEGHDYQYREKLMELLETQFRKSASAEESEPWERYSAASGIAVYSPESDEDIGQVFRRADEAMYENKKQMKATRE